MTTPLATVGLSCGRQYLKVAGVIVAMEGDKCRDSDIPEDILPPIPLFELDNARIGDKLAKDLPIKVVRFFRGDDWNGKMLQWAADKINNAAKGKP